MAAVWPDKKSAGVRKKGVAMLTSADAFEGVLCGDFFICEDQRIHLKIVHLIYFSDSDKI